MMTQLAFAGYRSFEAGPDDEYRAKWNGVRFSLDVSVAIGATTLPAIGILNTQINREIKYTPDSTDNWQTPLQTLSLKTGDCEDYAILKYALLTKAGIPARLVIGEIRKLGMGNLNGNLPHAWCAVFIEGRWFALDNNADRPIPVEDYPNWTPLAAMHEASVIRFGREFTIAERMKSFS